MKMVETGFHAPRYSVANGGCFDVAHNGDVVLLRDSKDNGTGQVLQFSRAEWRELISAVSAETWPEWVTPVDGGGLEVRMAGDPGGPVLTFEPHEVNAFVKSVLDGDPQMIGPQMIGPQKS